MVAERRVAISVNGSLVEQYVEPRMLLVHFLRSCQGLTSTRVGCDTSSCGACTVLLDGANVKSCTIFAVQADGRNVTTLEGLTGPDGQLSPIQEAFRSAHGLQCGFCTPGIIMAAYPYVTQGVDDPDDDEIREVISGNLCRCTGYGNVVAAIRAALRAYASRTPEH